VAMISRIIKVIVIFCRIQSILKGFFAKETNNFKEPTNRSLLTVATPSVDVYKNTMIHACIYSAVRACTLFTHITTAAQVVLCMVHHTRVHVHICRCMY